MVRIKIDWEMVSPFLQTINGILIIEKFQNSEPKVKEILKCKVTKKIGQTGYTSIGERGYSSEIFKKYEDRIAAIVDSYFNGTILSKTIYSWVDK